MYQLDNSQSVIVRIRMLTFRCFDCKAVGC
jgi:hypothetical protein